MYTKFSNQNHLSFIGWDEKGYGPKGEHTREQWRKECIENLLVGKNQFDTWQNNWKDHINEDLENINFGFQVLDPKTTLEELKVSEYCKPYSLDFVGVDINCDLLLNQYIFQQQVLFRNAHFNSSANFQNTEFKHFLKRQF